MIKYSGFYLEYFFVAGAITMTVDQHSRYLVTGDCDGFVKVWNISEYCLQPDDPPLTKQPRTYLFYSFNVESYNN